MKWTKGEYQIICLSGPKTVQGYISPGGVFGITQRTRHGRWGLTHIPSGRSCCTSRTREGTESRVIACEAIPGIKQLRGLKTTSKAFQAFHDIMLGDALEIIMH